MKFRPCIDIHNGKVKQIVGGSLTDVQDQASENFVSEQDASFYAELYKKAGIKGGHVILLNGHDSPDYESTKEQAILALHTYPGGLQIGGGVNPENAGEYLSAGASHVIVTSYVFKDGRISWENLNKMKETVGKEKLVLDLSCRRKDGKYYIVTDRWQKFTDVTVTLDIMKELGSYCDEFLVHAAEPLRLFMFLYYVFNMYQKLNTILEKIYFSCYDLNNTKQITPYIYTPTI